MENSRLILPLGAGSAAPPKKEFIRLNRLLNSCLHPMISKQSMEDKVRREKKRDKKKEYECETSCFRSFLLLCCTDNNIHR